MEKKEHRDDLLTVSNKAAITKVAKPTINFKKQLTVMKQKSQHCDSTFILLLYKNKYFNIYIAMCWLTICLQQLPYVLN